MRRLMLSSLTAIVFAVPMTAAASAQQTATTPPLEIGAVAPDFELPGATRYGVLDRPVKLSDFQGEVVVLAFFFKARTKG